jgi:hypothetical protein
MCFHGSLSSAAVSPLGVGCATILPMEIISTGMRLLNAPISCIYTSQRMGMEAEHVQIAQLAAWLVHILVNFRLGNRQTAPLGHFNVNYANCLSND